MDLDNIQISGTLRCNSGAGNRGPYHGYPGNPTAYPGGSETFQHDNYTPYTTLTYLIRYDLPYPPHT